MKKGVLAWGLVVMVTILLIGCGNKDTKNTYKETIEFKKTIYEKKDSKLTNNAHFKVNGEDSIIYAQGITLYQIKQDGERMSKMLGQAVNGICIGEEEIYTASLIYKNGDPKIKFNKLNNAFNTEEYIFNMNCLSLDGEDISLSKMVYSDKKLFVLYDLGGTMEVYTYNLETNEVMQLEIGTLEILDFTPLSDGLIALKVYEDNGYETRLDIYNYNEKKKIEEIKDISIDILSFNSEENIIYGVSENQLTKIGLNDYDVEKYCYDFSADQRCLLKNYCYLYNEKIGTVEKINLDFFNKVDFLEVLVPEKFMDRRFINFNAYYNKSKPRLQIKYNKIPSKIYVDQLNMKFMSGSEDFDLFVLDSCNYYNFTDKQIPHDLSRYEQINTCFSDMFEGIKGLCEVGDYLFGVPSSIYMNGMNTWMIDESILKNANSTIPRNEWEWVDFVNICKKISETNVSQEVLVCEEEWFWESCFLNIYENKYLDLENKSYTSNLVELVFGLEMTEYLYDYNIITDERWVQTNNHGAFAFNCIPMWDTSNHKTMVTIPRVDQDNPNIFSASMEYFCVNSKSHSLEAGIDYISHLISKDTQRRDLIVIGTPLLYKDTTIYKDTSLEPFVEAEDCLNIYQYVLKHVDKTNIFYEEGIMEIFKAFRQKEVTAEEAAYEIDKIFTRRINE